jgi:hypothetical protein
VGAGLIRSDTPLLVTSQAVAPGAEKSKFKRLVNAGTIAVLIGLAFFALALTLQWRGGAYHNGFGTFPDEPSHYVTGLMVYKYLTSALGVNPMAFAERFYAHYPAVGFGHWPPLFYALQAAWGLPFGLSRTSVLVLMAVIASVCAVLISRALWKRMGAVYAAVFGFLFVVLPIVRGHTGAVMAELPLTLFSFAAVLAFVRLLEKPSRLRAWTCGFALAAAILVKGDGWALLVLPVCVALLADHPGQFARKWIWITLAPVAVLCVPYMLLTIGLATDGFEQAVPSWAFARKALYQYAVDHVRVFGAPVLALALVGAVGTLASVLRKPRQLEAVWILNVAVIASVYIFHAVVPTSIEPRKIFMSIPSLLLLAASGLKRVAELTTPKPSALNRWIREAAYPLAAGGLITMIWLTHTTLPVHRNMGSAAQAVLDSSGLERSAVCVASTSFNEGEELSFVAEVAAREHADFHHAVVRAGKLLADSSWMGTDYKLRYTDPAEVAGLMNSIPISRLVLYLGGARPMSHARLIEQVVAAHPDDWNLLADQPVHGGVVEIFAARMPRPGPVRLPQIDLRRKLGRNISAEF